MVGDIEFFRRRQGMPKGACDCLAGDYLVGCWLAVEERVIRT